MSVRGGDRTLVQGRKAAPPRGAPPANVKMKPTCRGLHVGSAEDFIGAQRTGPPAGREDIQPDHEIAATDRPQRGPRDGATTLGAWMGLGGCRHSKLASERTLT